MRLNLWWTYVSREWNEVISEVLAEMKCAMQEAAEMICAMEVSTQVKSILSKNHPWSMKAVTKVKIYEGCSNCTEIYDVSIMWNEWKAATKMKSVIKVINEMKLVIEIVNEIKSLMDICK